MPALDPERSRPMNGPPHMEDDGLGQANCATSWQVAARQQPARRARAGRPCLAAIDGGRDIRRRIGNPALDAKCPRQVSLNGRCSTKSKNLVLCFLCPREPRFPDDDGSKRLEGAHSNSCSGWSNSSTRFLASPLPFDPSCSETEARTAWPTERL